VTFSDATAVSGVKFVHNQSRKGEINYLPQTLGPGVASFDMDGDGLQELFFVQGRDGEKASHLYRAVDLESAASEVAAHAGANVVGWGQACLAEDLDVDGYTDLVITSYREPVRVLWNQGDGTFRATTLSAEGGDERWWSALAAVDLERDGLPDLYVGAYVEFGPKHWLEKPAMQTVDGLAPVPETMLPGPYNSAPNAFFRHAGARRWRDATKELGVANEAGRTLGILAADLDADGWTDLFVANDVSPCALYRNKKGTLVDFTGNAYVGESRGSMGLALGDPNGDGAMDIVCTHWIGDVPALYMNMLKGAKRLAFKDDADRSGLSTLPRSLVGWSVAFLDFENDAIDDLLIVHGHTSHDPQRPGHLEAQPSYRLAGKPGGKFEIVVPEHGSPEAPDAKRVGRGAAFADLDRDGRVDVALGTNNGAASIWRNQRAGGRWLTLELVGTRSARSGLGADVLLKSGGRTRRKQRVSGDSYFSANPPVLHFGLGDGAAEELVVSWPAGSRETFGPLKPSSYVRVVEGTGRISP
jgi:hypothetical protein